MSDPSPVTLSVRCVRCGRPVTLIYTPTLVIRSQDWACPHDGCWLLQRSDVPGKDVTARRVPDERVTLPIRCPVCGQAVALIYEMSERRERVWWACPHTDCHHVERLELNGRIVRVVARDRPPLNL